MKVATASTDALPAPAWLSRGRVPSLDGIRAIAVAFVLASHAMITQGFPVYVARPIVTRLGVAGVDIFFVLSGFLITSLLCREHERTQRVSFRAFYYRRVLRIVPAYLCFIAFVAALSLSGKTTIPRADWVAAATYTMNFRAHPAWDVGHIWSLSIEEHFYLLWPLLFAFLPRRSAIVGLGAVLLVEPLLRLAILAWSPTLAIESELWTFTRIDTIAAGCLLALLSRTPSGFRLLEPAVRGWPLAVALLLAAMAGSRYSGKFEVGVAPTLYALAFAALVWAAIRNEPSWLESRTLIVLGVGSYSLYLWQQVFLNASRPDWWCRFPQNVVFAAVFAAFSYRVIERPFIRIKQRRAAAD